MTSRVRRNQQQTGTDLISDRLDSAILWITLGTLFIVPLIFSFAGFVSVFSELKLVTLHLGAGLIATLWLWQIAISTLNASTTRHDAKTFDLLRWASREPARWLVVLAVGWLVAQVISTLLSPLPINQPLWRRRRPLRIQPLRQHLTLRNLLHGRHSIPIGTTSEVARPRTDQLWHYRRRLRNRTALRMGPNWR